MKINLEFERDKVLTVFNRHGLNRNVGFAKVSENLELYDTFMIKLIKSAKFAYKTRQEAQLLSDSGKYLILKQYPKNIKVIDEEHGFDLKSGMRVIVKDKKKKAMRLCRKHNVEYPVGSKCPDCQD